jgi:RNA-directed DNA polymerase
MQLMEAVVERSNMTLALRRVESNDGSAGVDALGRRLDRFIEQELNPMLRGWGNYFQLAQVEGTFDELDGWVRRKLRQMVWRQWKRSHTRATRMMQRGLAKERAWKSAANGRGSWWNSGASHMNEAFPKRYFDQVGLLSLLNQKRGVLKTT